MRLMPCCSSIDAPILRIFGVRSQSTDQFRFVTVYILFNPGV